MLEGIGAPGISFESLLLALIRPLTMFSVLPLFAPQLFPSSIRNTVALSLMLPIAGLLITTVDPINLSWGQLILLALKETTIGVGIGYILGGIFWAAENVGHVIDMQTGLTASSMADPFSGNQSSVTSPLLMKLFIALFVAADGLHLMTNLLYGSYTIWPVHTLLPGIGESTVNFFIARTGDLVFLTLLLAAPVILTLNSLELAVGLMNRTAPAFQVTTFTQPVKGWVSLLILLVSLQAIADRMLSVIRAYPDTLRELSKVW